MTWALLSAFCLITAGEVLFADVLMLPNGMSKVGATVKNAGGFLALISFVGLFGFW